jgi:hypothetical protein
MRYQYRLTQSAPSARTVINSVNWYDWKSRIEKLDNTYKALESFGTVFDAGVLKNVGQSQQKMSELLEAIDQKFSKIEKDIEKHSNRLQRKKTHSIFCPFLLSHTTNIAIKVTTTCCSTNLIDEMLYSTRKFLVANAKWGQTMQNPANGCDVSLLNMPLGHLVHLEIHQYFGYEDLVSVF